MQPAPDHSAPPASEPASGSHRLNLRLLRHRVDPGCDAMLAWELIAEGRVAEAVDMTSKGLEADPDDPDLLLTLGVGLRELGDLDTAQLSLMRAAGRDPEWVEPCAAHH